MSGGQSKGFGWALDALVNVIPGAHMGLIQFPKKIIPVVKNKFMLRRPRRNRQSAATRGMIRETRLHTDNLIYPLFLIDPFTTTLTRNGKGTGSTSYEGLAMVIDRKRFYVLQMKGKLRDDFLLFYDNERLSV